MVFFFFFHFNFFLGFFCKVQLIKEARNIFVCETQVIHIFCKHDFLKVFFSHPYAINLNVLLIHLQHTIGLDAVFKGSYVFHNAKADLQFLAAQDFKSKSIYW